MVLTLKRDVLIRGWPFRISKLSPEAALAGRGWLHQDLTGFPWSGVIRHNSLREQPVTAGLAAPMAMY